MRTRSPSAIHGASEAFQVVTRVWVLLIGVHQLRRRSRAATAMPLHRGFRRHRPTAPAARGTNDNGHTCAPGNVIRRPSYNLGKLRKGETVSAVLRSRKSRHRKPTNVVVGGYYGRFYSCGVRGGNTESLTVVELVVQRFEPVT